MNDWARALSGHHLLYNGRQPPYNDSWRNNTKCWIHSECTLTCVHGAICVLTPAACVTGCTKGQWVVRLQSSSSIGTDLGIYTKPPSPLRPGHQQEFTCTSNYHQLHSLDFSRWLSSLRHILIFFKLHTWSCCCLKNYCCEYFYTNPDDLAYGNEVEEGLQLRLWIH